MIVNKRKSMLDGLQLEPKKEGYRPLLLFSLQVLKRDHQI